MEPIFHNLCFSPNAYEKSLNPADIADIEEAEFHSNLKKSKIIDRAFYICSVIAKHSNLKLDKNCEYESSELSSFTEHEDDIFVFNITRPFIDSGIVKTIYDNHEFTLVEQWGGVSFPSKWLYCDFEPELIEGLESYKKKIEEKETRLKAKKKAYRIRSKIVNRLKKTMTPEEIEIVFGKDLKDEN